MRRRGFTLVEVLITVFIIGLITAVFFPILIKDLRILSESFGFTEATYEAQTLVEQEIVDIKEKLGSTATPGTTLSSIDYPRLKVNLFKTNPADTSSTIDLLTRQMKTTAKNIDAIKDYTRDVLVLLPIKQYVMPKYPTIKVKMEPTSGAGVTEFRGIVTYDNIKNDDGTYSAKSWKDEVEFCIYRWYLCENKSGKIDFDTLVPIKEYNKTKNDGNPLKFDKASQLESANLKKPFIYEGEKYIPVAATSYYILKGNIPNGHGNKFATDEQKKLGDKIDISSLNSDPSDGANNFSADEIKGIFRNKALVFSAIPVLKSGEVGKETYSKNIVDLGYDNTEMLIAAAETITTIPGGSAYRVKFLFKINGRIDTTKDYYVKYKNASGYSPFYAHFNDTKNAFENLTGLPKKLNIDTNGYLSFDFIFNRKGKHLLMIDDESGNSLDAVFEIK